MGRPARSRLGTLRRLARVKRGEIYTAAPPGDHGKPRAVVIVQSDVFTDRDSVTVYR